MRRGQAFASVAGGSTGARSSLAFHCGEPQTGTNAWGNYRPCVPLAVSSGCPLRAAAWLEGRPSCRITGSTCSLGLERLVLRQGSSEQCSERGTSRSRRREDGPTVSCAARGTRCLVGKLGGTRSPSAGTGRDAAPQSSPPQSRLHLGLGAGVASQPWAFCGGWARGPAVPAPPPGGCRRSVSWADSATSPRGAAD